MRYLARAVTTQAPRAQASLIARLGDSRDIAACCTLLEEFRFVYDNVTWRSLPGLFSSLLKIGALQLCLVEDRAAADNASIVAFCASIFVADAFCSEARAKLPPYLGLQIARRFQESKLLALDRKQIAFANFKTGVSVVTGFCGTQCDSLPRERVFAVREKVAEAFRLAHQGYNLKEVICGPIGEDTLQWALDAGFRLRRDYSDFYHAANFQMPETAKRPWLVGLTKEEALANYGSRASGLFVFTAPRFRFSLCEQAVLRRSLVGETDEEMASHLCISPWTVKKRWQSIYERVSRSDVRLLRSAIREVASESRGAERRRHLLDYLRQHPEELCPLRPS
jgi:DNA-binding CsgD family transcriptional regulator